MNKLDRERASFSRTLDELKDKFGAGVAPLQLPIGEEAEFHGVVELLDDHAVHYVDGKATEGPIPPEMETEEHSIHDALIEGIVVGDDDLMERYLADETIPIVRARARARPTAWRRASVFPVLCGSATKLIGVDRLARLHRRGRPARPAAAGDGPPVAFVFKTIVDPYVGHVNLFKVLQGTVKTDATLVNGRTMHEERLHQLSVMRGKEQEPVSEVPAGDIAAVAKLADTTTGDVLGARGADIEVEPFEPPAPVLAVAIRAKSKSDEDKLANALHRLLDEDPALQLERNAETHQTLLWGHGRDAPRHRARSGCTRKLGVEVETEDVKVAYRETITARGRGRGQVQEADRRPRPVRRGVRAGRAARARRRLRVRRQDRRRRDPAPVHPRGREGRARDDGARRRVRLPRRRREGHLLRRQVPLGRLVGDELQDGGLDRLQGGDGQGRPILLEPVSELVVLAPEAHQGDIMGDLNSKRGRIQGSSAAGNGEVEIVALVPDVGDPALRDRPALDDRRPRPLLRRRTRTTTRCPRTSSTRCAPPSRNSVPSVTF